MATVCSSSMGAKARKDRQQAAREVLEAKLQAAFSRILVLEVALATCHVETPVSQDPVQAQHFTAIQVPTEMVDRVQAITVGLIWHIYCNFCAGVPHHFAAQAAASCGKQIRKAAKIPLAAANEAKHSFETGATHRWTDTERTHIQDIRGQMSSTAVQSSYGTQHSIQQPQVWTVLEAGHVGNPLRKQGHAKGTVRSSAGPPSWIHGHAKGTERRSAGPESVAEDFTSGVEDFAGDKVADQQDQEGEVQVEQHPMLARYKPGPLDDPETIMDNDIERYRALLQECTDLAEQQRSGIDEEAQQQVSATLTIFSRAMCEAMDILKSSGGWERMRQQNLRQHHSQRLAASPAPKAECKQQ